MYRLLHILFSGFFGLKGACNWLFSASVCGARSYYRVVHGQRRDLLLPVIRVSVNYRIGSPHRSYSRRISATSFALVRSAFSYLWSSCEQSTPNLRVLSMRFMLGLLGENKTRTILQISAAATLERANCLRAQAVAVRQLAVSLGQHQADDRQAFYSFSWPQSRGAPD
jgi:hypothetical protein